MKVTAKASNGSALASFGFPNAALFGELVEQGVARAQEGCERHRKAARE
jgi:hypothetical protein